MVNGIKQLVALWIILEESYFIALEILNNNNLKMNFNILLTRF